MADAIPEYCIDIKFVESVKEICRRVVDEKLFLRFDPDKSQKVTQEELKIGLQYRNKVTRWLHKILKSNKTLIDLKLRNEFLQLLKENVQNKKLQPPFTQDPPKTTLKALVRQLPGHDEIPAQDDEAVAMLRFLPAKHGGFLLPKPLPSIGAYIYIAASSQPECL